MQVLTVDALDAVVAALREQGRRVIGPVIDNGVITHGEIESIAALPRGNTEDQDGGYYRLEPTGTDELFAFSSPSSSWKRYLYPERTLLVRSHRRNGTIEIDRDDLDPLPAPLAFFGVRSCDLAAIGLLDRVFLDPVATDGSYANRRADVFLVAVACHHPGNTCFCASMGTGPTPLAACDLALRELYDEDGQRFLIERASPRAVALLDAIALRPATARDLDAARAGHETAVARMGRELRATDPPLVALAPDHARWDDVADRCLACGNCTMVCPTCFCSTTQDSTDLTGDQAERWRVWDSCFALDFSYMHGGSVRTSTKARYRQWLLHKLVTWHDQFGSSGCVGCGRCITWCPVGIDLTQEVAAIARAQHDADGMAAASPVGGVS